MGWRRFLPKLLILHQEQSLPIAQPFSQPEAALCGASGEKVNGPPRWALGKEEILQSFLKAV